MLRKLPDHEETLLNLFIKLIRTQWLATKWGKGEGKLIGACSTELDGYQESREKQFVAPLICGQILFLQVSTHTSAAKADASRHSRRSDVRAKNLRGKIKASEHKALLILPQKP